jgi:hypothetical protein
MRLARWLSHLFLPAEAYLTLNAAILNGTLEELLEQIRLNRNAAPWHRPFLRASLDLTCRYGELLLTARQSGYDAGRAVALIKPDSIADRRSMLAANPRVRISDIQVRRANALLQEL